MDGCYWWSETRDLLEHKRSSSVHTGWGCNEGKQICTRSGAGRTGQRNEPGGTTRSPPLTPVSGQWDTWERGWRGDQDHYTSPDKKPFSNSRYTTQTTCRGSLGILTCSGWEGILWNRQGLMNEMRSSPPELLQSWDLSSPQRRPRTTASPLAGWRGPVDKPLCSWSCGTEPWRLWLWDQTLKCHHPACQEKYAFFCYDMSYGKKMSVFSSSGYCYFPYIQFISKQ